LEFIATHVKDKSASSKGPSSGDRVHASLNGERVSLDPRRARPLADIVSAGEPRRVTPQMILDAPPASYGFSVES